MLLEAPIPPNNTSSVHFQLKSPNIDISIYHFLVQKILQTTKTTTGSVAIFFHTQSHRPHLLLFFFFACKPFVLVFSLFKAKPFLRPTHPLVSRFLPTNSATVFPFFFVRSPIVCIFVYNSASQCRTTLPTP